MNKRNLIALQHSKTIGFATQVEKTQRIVEQWLEKSGKVTVSFSGGKDSTALLHLVRSYQADAPAVYTEGQWQLPETKELMEGTSNLIRIHRKSKHCDWLVDWAELETPEYKNKKTDAKNIWAKDHGYDGVGIGLRADENSRRSIHIKTKGVMFFTKFEIWQCYPLAWWRCKDVWAYLVKHDILYNKAYDVMEQIGVPVDQQRIGPLAVDRVLGFGQLAILKKGWPELFNQFAAEFPQARNFV